VHVEGDTPPHINGAALPEEGSLLALGDEIEIAGAKLRFHPGRDPAGAWRCAAFATSGGAPSANRLLRLSRLPGVVSQRVALCRTASFERRTQVTSRVTLGRAGGGKARGRHVA